MNDLFDVSGKVAVVTGGSRGIGAMIARGLVESGVRTYISARKEAELQSTVEELSALGQCIGIRADLSSQEGVDALVSELVSREETLHILVNNAGATWGAGLDEFPESGWDKVMDLNVKSMFFLTQKLLPQLRAAGSSEDPARVINIGSINGITHSGMDNYSYTASKAAVKHLTQHLGAELAPQFVNVNGIAPGFFPSKMTAHLLPQEQETLTGIPCRRMGQTADAAGTVLYLCSRASNYVAGHMLVLDGGLVAAA